MNPRAQDPHSVTVNLRNADRYICDIQGGNHQLVADEPIPLGGDDLGMTPFQLLKAALGSCTSITLRMYAERKQWPLKDAIVTLRHRRDENKNSIFERDITLVGELDDKQRKRLLEIADRCPVHKTLDQGAIILTKLMD